ncbi:DNA helicase RecQ [Alienimonas californiensis]|uniref:DNA helicase RecQ n=1 Tax=Alienimonas californiensis TaxID=2527989 RepID=A0A517P4P7_9PLAN|nr:DNA helicase RecQ [Alienimonas californiensis]QDT14325.1 ATP-dependent DNA helicase RecQ [Alienimonas californiensis]
MNTEQADTDTADTDTDTADTGRSDTERAEGDEAELRAVLRDFWGYDSFRPLQKEAMQCGLAGRDSVVVLPTGGGKSLCYQAPAAVLHRRTGAVAVVVSPLIALMKDQVDALTAIGVPAAFVNSTLPPEEKIAVSRRLRDKELACLYAAPETLVTDRMLDFLSELDVSFVAIDEAHCVSQWGHDFRPEYRQLGMLRERFPDAAMHGYTATAGQKVREDVAFQLNLHDPAMLVGSFDRPNLTFRARPASGTLGQIREVVKRHDGESGIVYCISRKKVDETADALRGLGVRAIAYHAGMSKEERTAAQDAFLADREDVVVATVAFGMGIDKPDVRFVVHAGMPKSIEHYQQEAGRAGRDGLASECLLLHSGGDYRFWKSTLGELPPEPRANAEQSLNALYDYAQGALCRHKALVRYFDQDLESDDCGACDICLGEVETVDDPLILGQKIVSCVYRLEQRFGGNHTADVLTGSKSEAVLSKGHDSLSTYGLLSDHPKKAVRDWIEQLVGQGFLAKVGEYATLRITEAGQQLLKGERKPVLLAPAKKVAAERPKRTSSAADDWEGVDEELFEHLRGVRGEVAREIGKPAYIVFNDASLKDMARRRPTTEEGLSHCVGVGPKKLEDFGERFLEEIGAHCAEHGLTVDVEGGGASGGGASGGSMFGGSRSISRNAAAAFPLFRDGLGVADAARELRVTESTAAGYLRDYILETKHDDPTTWVEPAAARQAREAFEACGLHRLKPAFEHLDGAVSYDDLKIVAACMAAGQSA